jgi:hypothetical protein
MALHTRHINQLRASAISDDIMRERGYWTAEDRNEWAQRDGHMADFQVKLPGLAIPTYRLGQSYTLVLRPDEPRTQQRDGKTRTIKYEWPNGLPLCFDMLPRYRDSLKDTSIDIWLTEGSKKADALASLGKSIVPISINGVWGWRSKNADGESKPIADFDDIAWKGRRVVLAFDSDYATNEQVQKALSALADELHQRGADVYFAAWPEQYKGVDDAIAAGITYDVIDASIKPYKARERFTFLLDDAIDAIPDPRFLVKGVLTMGEVTVIAGAGDSGKTTLVTDLSFRIAQHAPVVYIAAEDASGIKLRRRAWMQHHKHSAGHFALLGDGNGTPCAVQLMDETQISDLIASLRPLEAAVVVVDTLSQCSSGADENGNDMTKLAASCNRIAHETGAAVIVIHHTTKDGKHYRGHSSLKDNTYGFHEVSKDDNYITLSRIRVKNTGGDYKRKFGMCVITLGYDDDGDPITSTVPVPAAQFKPPEGLQPKERKVLEMIVLSQDVGDQLTHSKLVKWADKEFSIPEGSTKRYLRSLRKKSFASPAGEAAITPTQAGRAALEENNVEVSSGDNGGDMWTINLRVVGSNTSEPTAEPDPEPGARYDPTGSGEVQDENLNTMPDTGDGFTGFTPGSKGAAISWGG